MRTYVLRRLLLAIPTLIGITLLTFVVSRMAPGGPIEVYAASLEEQGVHVSAEQLQRTRELLGLDQSLPVQYLQWLRRAAFLDFGKSMAPDRELVRTKVLRAFKVSFLLQLLSIVLIYVLAVPLGVFAAIRKGSLLERFSTLAMFFLYSIPNFFLASLLVLWLCSGRPLQLFPILGLQSLDTEGFTTWEKVLDYAWHLVLPVTCLTYGGLASISRYTRAGMLEVIQQDYIRTARAKGLPERLVLARHAFRNSVIPLVTLLATLFPYLLGGSVVIETIFGIPGMGLLAYQSVFERDYPTVMALSTFVGVATLVGFLLSDLLYVLVDPRIALE